MEEKPPESPDAGATPPPPSESAPPPPGGALPGSSEGGSDVIAPSATPKDPVLVLVLNLIFLCVGYFIYGQWQKGLAAIAVALILTVGTCFMGTPVLPLLAILTAIDGYMQADQLKNGFSLRQWTFFQNHL